MTPMDTVLNSLLSIQARNMSVEQLSATRQFATIANALDAALDYFADRMDCDDGTTPNECMRMVLEVEQAQAALKSLRERGCTA